MKVSFRGSGHADTKIVTSSRPFEHCMDSRLYVDVENVRGIIRHLSMSYRKESCKSAQCSCTVYSCRSAGVYMCKPCAQCGCRARARRAKCVGVFVQHTVCSCCSNVLGVGVASCVCV